jgi:glyoxylase-like metal-dependent hydrolase (beta-lactamase superfamily II)
MLQVGPWEIESVVTGRFRLDGGAMFGVVPKVLWQKVAPADELNRISLATRTLLAVHRPAGRILLADTGFGPKWSPDAAERYAVEPDLDAIEAALRRRSASPADVTDVVVTHLHFDHAGGLSTWADRPGGATRLLFPEATHWMHARHWRHARSPTLRDRASFLPVDYAALEHSPKLRLVDGDRPAEVPPDVEWFVANGHTPAQLLPILHGGSDGEVLFVGDVVPTAAHLPVAWVMAYDLEPLASVAERQAVYRRVREKGLLLAFPHDLDSGLVRLDFQGDRPRVVERW